MKVWNAEANDLFLQALELQPGPERHAFLNKACGSNSEVRRRVEALLAASEQAGSFLESPAFESGDIPTQETDRGPTDASGAVVGPYKLLEKIGEGGFGSVYMAEQIQPVNRRVALKVIKPGMDSRQVIARFEAERQALAMMDHPNIARVLDAGATDAQSALGPGRPYFAMELVRGIPITTFCDEDNLTIRQRLGLFTDVCHAVQHAHQKGVIHRDIKPTNVLVTMHDDKPVPKVIDFGVAKATHGRLTEKTVFTEFRQLIGTPAYMSPEQAQMSGIDVDTRSDIYSLGVLLYELLTGTTPFDNRTLLGAGFDEMRRMIREVEPPTPSTSVATMQQARLRSGAPARPDDAAVAFKDSAEIARRRATDPRSLCGQLRGELDWIVMKCLEKDRERRYKTANSLALEVERYLKNEPVLAGRPSQLYRFRKFARRNRAVVTASAVVAAALLAGMAGTTFGLLRAEERWAEAEAARNQTQQVSEFQAAMLREIDVEAMGRGIKKRFREQVRAALAWQYVGDGPDRRKLTLEDIEAEMAAFDGYAEVVGPVTLAQLVVDDFVLAPAANALEEQFAEDPLVLAQLHNAIGKTYRQLGLDATAEPHLRRALEIARGEPGQAHELVADSLRELGSLLFKQGDTAAAELLLREAIALCRRLYGDESRQVADLLGMLGGLQRALGHEGEAERLYREALAMARKVLSHDSPSVAAHENNLAGLLLKRADFAAAEALYTEALAIQRNAYGQEHPEVVITLNNLAYLLWARGGDAEAEPIVHINPANGHRYRRSSFRCWGASDSTPGRMQPDWWDAEAEAQALGGHLVTINDAAENDWLVTTFGPESFWTGLTDWGSEGTFHWISGTPVTYTNWDNYEPNNAHAGGEDCVHFNHHNGPGRWNDLGEQGNSPHHAIPYYAIIELETELETLPGP